MHTEVESIPAKAKAKQILQQIAKCTVCGTAQGNDRPCYFWKVAVPTLPLPALLLPNR